MRGNKLEKSHVHILYSETHSENPDLPVHHERLPIKSLTIC